MNGDVLYVVGTVAQVFAFACGVRVTVLGLALAAYGVALFIFGAVSQR